MSDPNSTYLLLCATAFVAGVINSVAGGGTLLTFPALLEALGGNGVLANGTSTVAIVPGSFAGAWGYRQELADKRVIFRRLIVPSLLGGAVGALLVTELPPAVFNTLVPWLILTAALLFMLQRPILRWFGAHHFEGAPSQRMIAWIGIFQFFVAVYGGYFGAGIGILMLSALGFMAVGDIHHMNGVKTLLAAGINAMAVVVFVARGQVNWNYALTMAVACIAGGYLGVWVARRLKPGFVRGVVVVIGLGMSAFYFWKQIVNN